LSGNDRQTDGGEDRNAAGGEPVCVAGDGDITCAIEDEDIGNRKRHGARPCDARVVGKVYAILLPPERERRVAERGNGEQRVAVDENALADRLREYQGSALIFVCAQIDNAIDDARAAIKVE